MKKNLNFGILLLILILCGTLLVMGCSNQQASTASAEKQSTKYIPSTVAAPDLDVQKSQKAQEQQKDQVQVTPMQMQDDGLDQALADLDSVE